MLIARGDPMTFFYRPISASVARAVGVLLVLALLPMIRQRRDEVFVESEGWAGLKRRPCPHPPCGRGERDDVLRHSPSRSEVLDIASERGSVRGYGLPTKLIFA